MVFLEELALAREEVVAGCAEALKYLHVHLLRREAYRLPLLLQLNDLFRLLLPVGRAFLFLGGDGLYFLAELRLAL